MTSCFSSLTLKYIIVHQYMCVGNYDCIYLIVAYFNQRPPISEYHEKYLTRMLENCWKDTPKVTSVYFVAFILVVGWVTEGKQCTSRYCNVLRLRAYWGEPERAPH